ncbi:MAG TPA: ATP-binding protein [Candidatus Bathyarchaeia archaeon]|nr:ATP-binding protein [Candidatus Bathyarchaeia archaeon]
MMINRALSAIITRLSKQFPVIAIMGPRQSGKTTLVKHLFSHYTYVTLEDIDIRALAQEDPRAFFASYAHHEGLIIDEIQEVPHLFSYMQGIVDALNRPGFFVITGSQNFLLYEQITQTLAGRIALLTLLPLSIEELAAANLLPATPEQTILQGFYPRPYAHTIDRQIWLSNYVATYVERDVRQVLNVSNVIAFQRFLKLCAARVGQLINYADLARDADIAPNTAKAWISILEASYIIKLLYPYFKNFNKRIIKSPKLYFCDTGLACSLLGVKTAQELYLHPLRGPLFESMIIGELFKCYYNESLIPPLYFWRDVQGHEVDCIIEKSSDVLIPIEIKAGMTVHSDFFKGIAEWRAISQDKKGSAYVIYGGNTEHKQAQSHLIAWNHIAQLFSLHLK